METQQFAGEQDWLKRVTVRLVREEKRGEFDFRLEEDRQPFVLACAAVATLMGAGGYQPVIKGLGSAA